MSGAGDDVVGGDGMECEGDGGSECYVHGAACMAGGEVVRRHSMKFAYSDPPYLGQGKKLYGDLHSHAHTWDDPETHREHIEWLCDTFPDGWAMSASTPSLRTILPMCPEDVRVASWVKTFSAFKKGVRPAYSWEPVIWRGGRNPGMGFKHLPPPKDGKQNTPKDFYITEHDAWDVLACPITLRKGLTGAKPEAFCLWVLDLLNVQPGDKLVDVFPGTGVMTQVYLSLSSADNPAGGDAA
jgi:hypothetical protein